MSMSTTQKSRIIRSLRKTKQTTASLETHLRFVGEKEQADVLQQKVTELSRLIDRLLAREMEDWVGDSARILETQKANNAALQENIEQIKKAGGKMTGVVVAVGYVEEAIAIAMKLLP